MPSVQAGSRKRRQAGPELTPDAAQVLRQFRVIFNSVRRHFRAVETKAGISGAHVWALGVLAEHPGVGVNDLAAAMDVHQSTASNLLRTLAAQGLAAVERDEVDKRAVRLHLTGRGERILQRAPAPFTGVLPDALLELDPRTLKRLKRDLGELMKILSPNDDGARVPLGSQR